MKKYLKSFFFAILIGTLISKVFLNQYKDYNGIAVSNNSSSVYFIQYGVYSDGNSMEENTINLQNFIYNTDSGKYYVYVGITSLDENKDKIVNYYKSLGYDTIVKEYGISNKYFLEKLKNLDEVLKNSTNRTTTASIISAILETYEEVVINGNKD